MLMRHFSSSKILILGQNLSFWHHWCLQAQLPSFQCCMQKKHKNQHTFTCPNPHSFSSLTPSLTGHHTDSTVNMSRMAGASDGSISEEDKPSRTSQTEAFVSELMHLLRCDNEALGVQIRETVKELISYELSPAVYPYLFECMMTESGKVCNLP